MEDYERENAREWNLYAKPPPLKPTTSRPAVKNTSPQRGRSKQRPPAYSLPGERDNEAKAAWRTNEPPRAKFPIPQGSNFPEDAIRLKIEQISQHIQAHIALAPDKRTSQLWGNDDQIGKARNLFDGWLKELNPKLAAKGKPWKWPKIQSQTPEVRKVNEAQKYLEEKRQEFRRVPLPDTVFPSVGYFTWPEELYRPEEVLGANYEALDPIRMQYCCYIVYDKGLKVFKIMGNPDDVLEAVCRVRAICFQIAARSIMPKRAYRSHWGHSAALPARVRIFDDSHAYPLAITAGRKLPGPSKVPRGEGQLDEDEMEARGVSPEAQSSLSAKRIKDSIMKTLNKIKYYRGELILRARLGTSVLTTFQSTPDGTWFIEDFKDMLTEEEFAARVTPEIGFEYEEKTKSRSCEATDFLRRPNVFVKHSENVLPKYTSTITIGSVDDGGDLQLTKTWELNDGSFDCQARKWRRFDTGMEGPNILLEQCMTDLVDGSAWQFEVSATQAVEEGKLPQSLQDRGHWYYEIDTEKALADGGKGAWWDFKGHPMVDRAKAIEQRVTWHYGIVNSDYMVEIAQVQHFRWLKPSTGAPPGISVQLVTYEPRWELSVSHRNWETNFSQHADLEIGRAATWKADLPTWFPHDTIPGQKATAQAVGGGLESLMEKSLKIQGIVRGQKPETHDGMTVG